MTLEQIISFTGEARQLQTLEEVRCFFSRDRLQTGLDKLLRKNINDSFRNDMSETAAAETLRKHLPTDRVYTLADVIREQEKERYDWIGDCNIVLTFCEI